MTKAWAERINVLKYQTIESAEKALKDLHAAEYGSISAAEYKKEMHEIEKSISTIFYALSDGGSCADVLDMIAGMKHREKAFEAYLSHKKYLRYFYEISY